MNFFCQQALRDSKHVLTVNEALINFTVYDECLFWLQLKKMWLDVDKFEQIKSYINSWFFRTLVEKLLNIIVLNIFRFINRLVSSKTQNTWQISLQLLTFRRKKCICFVDPGLNRRVTCHAPSKVLRTLCHDLRARALDICLFIAYKNDQTALGEVTTVFKQQTVYNAWFKVNYKQLVDSGGFSMRAPCRYKNSNFFVVRKDAEKIYLKFNLCPKTEHVHFERY